MIATRRIICAIVVLLAGGVVSAKEPPKNPAGVPTNSYYSRTLARLDTPGGKRDYKKKDRDEMLTAAKAKDLKIAAYIKSNNIDDKISTAIWLAQPIIGMTEDQLVLFCYIHVDVETASTKELTVFVQPDELPTRGDDREHRYGLSLANGKIEAISRP